MWKVFKTFFKFATKDRARYGLLIACVVVSSVLENISPYFYKLFVDTIPSLNYPRLVQILLFYMAASVGSLLFVEASFWVGDKVAFSAGAKLRQHIFAWIQDLDMAFHSGKSTGSLISIFKRGDGAFFEFFFEVHHRILDIFIAICVMFVFFTKLDYRISLITLASIILTLVATRFLIGLNISRRKEFNDQEDRVSAIITDNLINYETVKLFAKERWEKGRLATAFRPWQKKLWNFSLSYRYIDATLGTIFNLAIFGMLLFSLRATTSLQMDIGNFVMVAGFISILFPRLWDLVWGIRDIAKHYSDMEKYFAVLDNQIEVRDPAKPIRVSHIYGEIELKKVKFAYKNRVRNAINGIDLKVEQGQSVALVGRSGSGKTTLAKLLMRFYDVTSGEILLDGINIKEFTKGTLRGFIGVVPQEPILFNNTVAYNIGYGKSRAKLTYIREAAKIANIDDFIQSLPKTYQTEVGERGVKLSGGQKQRLAIARMILSDPDIVIFDEATSQLDSESEKLIQDAFWKARAGKTTIIIAHRLSTIMRADKIVVMEKGKIKEVGTHQELLKKKDSLYSHFWNLQIKLD